MNGHRRAGASKGFGTRHPHLARMFGDPDARAHAEHTLGERHWFRTLFGGHAAVAVVVLLAVMCGVRLTGRLVSAVRERVPDAVPGSSGLWVALGLLVVAVVLLLLGRRRDPIRRAGARRIRIRRW